MVFKEIFVIVALVHVVGAVKVKSCGGPVRILKGDVKLINNQQKVMVRGTVEIDRKLGNLPFRYEVTIKKNGKNLGCSISACNGRLTCSVIKKNLNKNGIICTSKSLNRGSATIKSSPNRSVPGLQTMLGRLGKGKYTITAKLRALKGNKVYGCVELTTNKRG